MSEPTSKFSPAPGAPSPWRDALLLLLIFGVLYSFRLGSYPLSNPDEGRYAEIPREMLATGDWITPRLNGVNYFEKPPLGYWVTAVMEKICGENEWSVRAVPVIFALWGVLLVYAAGRRWRGRAAGWWAAMVLGTSLLWFVIGHLPLLDMAVSVLMAQALFAFFFGVQEPAGATRRGFFYLLYASMALATLAKGLIGFLVTGAVMFLWLLVFNQWRRLRPFYLPTGALLFLAIAAPWHVLAALHNETWVHRYFVFEHFERFLTPAASRPGPLHYFVWIVLAGLIPWTGFLWLSLRAALAGGWARRREKVDAWFLITWVVFVFFFFSVSKSKLPPYILPIFPALAVLVGAGLARTLEEKSSTALRGGLRVFTFLNGLLAAALLAAVLKPDLVIRDPEQLAALRAPGIALATILLLGGVLAPWLERVRGPRAALGALVVTMAAFFVALQFAAPDINKPGTKELALFVRERAQPGDRVLHYHEFFHDFTFYAARLVDVVAFEGELQLEEDAAARASGRFMGEEKFRELWSQPGRIFAVARKKDVREKLFRDPTFRYHLLAESPDHCLFSNQP
jgi:4-amino-4-deoxy-L-arabinose transferase-like glycosyltransferase